MNSAETVSLRSLATSGGLVGGPFGSSLVGSDYTASGIPVIRGTNLGHGRFVGGDFAYVSTAKANGELARNQAVRGDLVFTQRGTLGQVALVPNEGPEAYVVSQSQMRLRVDPNKADPRFVYYACAADDFKRQIDDHAIATGVPHINLGILGALRVPDRPLSEQRAIAEVLGALDDKIAANTHFATTAWKLSGARYMALTSTSTHRVALREVVEFHYGKALAADSRRRGTVLVYGSGGPVGDHDTPLVDGPGVVVGRKGTAGSVHWAPGPHFPIDTTFWVRPRPEYNLLFAYFTLSAAKLDELNSDSAVPGLNRSDAEAVLVPVPDEACLANFSVATRPLIDSASHLDQENLTLAATRDALLPALMSGALRVRDAERLAEHLT